MFKQPYLKFLWLIMMIIPLSLLGQTIVSTNQTNKNAVLEEFGGIYCVYCPNGHQILTELETALEERLVTINYHTGIYSHPIDDDPDLGNDYGHDLANNASVTGYPAATINRRNFPGLEQNEISGITAVGRANWAEAVTEAIQETSPVNIAAEATVDISTRELEIYLEYYYTGDANNSSNRLHIGILQNNVLAPQYGGVSGDFYLHKHLFREYITGSNGHIINNTHEGAFGSLTYNITIPEYYRDLCMDVVNLELVIFISENANSTLQGIQVTPNFFASSPVDAHLTALIAESNICGNELNAQVIMRNDGFHNLENCTIRYGLEGGPSHEILWSGLLSSLETTTIDLPVLPVYSENYENTFSAELLSPNDEYDPTLHNNHQTHSFTQAPIIESELIEIAIRTDNYGYEFYWEIVDDYGTVHASGGNQVVGETNGGAQIALETDPGAYENEVFIIEEIHLPANGCYQLRLIDDFADGLCCAYGNGFYRLRVPGQLPFMEGGEFDALEERYFSLGFVTTSINPEIGTAPEPSLFPNPINSQQSLAIQWANTPPSSYDWQISNGNGQLLQFGSQNKEPDLSRLAAGYYFFKLYYADKQRVLPLVLHR